MTTRDDVLLTVNQIIELYSVTPGVVRSWVLAGIIKPVVRQGKGRDGAMHFSRADVQSVVFGTCLSCGNGFKRTTRKQRFCGRLCRDRYRYRLQVAQSEHQEKFQESRAPIKAASASAAKIAAELSAKLKAMSKRMKG